MKNIKVEIMPSGRTVKLINLFEIYIDGELITIPRGFETDFASVPRICWSIIPPWGRYSTACLVHDYLYYTGQYSRIKSDKILLNIMKLYKVSSLSRDVIYKAVRIGGWKVWNKYRRHR